MSNFITSQKNKHKRELRKKEDAELLKQVKTMPTNKDGKVQINFQEKVLPTSLYVHMESGEIRFGDDVNPIKDCPLLHTMTNDIESAQKLLEILDNIGEVSKVIMDNTKDFKIFALEEFTNLLKKQVAKFEETQNPDTPNT